MAINIITINNTREENLMDILKMGAEMLMQKLGTSVDTDTMMSALTGLLGDGQDGLDLAALASKMMSSGDFGSMVESWLGDDANKNISPASLMSLLGENNIADFAGKVGVDASTAASGLSDVLPTMMDKASSGGNLLDSVGGADGLLGMAKKLF
jgi:uncharacterized protein YidB (DUF937 family)